MPKQVQNLYVREGLTTLETRVAAAYTSGGGTITVATGDGPKFDVFGTYPFLVTATHQVPGSAQSSVVYSVSSRSGDVITVVPTAGSSDISLSIGDLIQWQFQGSPFVNAAGGGGFLYTNVAVSAAVTASSTETLFSTFATIPANTLQPGTMIDIRFQGIATATNSTDTLTVVLYLGGLTGTALISLAATDVANSDVFQGEFKLIVRTIGSSGTVVGCGVYKSIPAAAGTMTSKDAILASTTLNTTIAQVVGVSATWSTTNAGNSCRLDVLSVRVSNP